MAPETQLFGRFGWNQWQHSTSATSWAPWRRAAHVRMGLMKAYRFSVVIEGDADGFYDHYPELQGCYSQGDSYDEALANIRDAIRLHVEDRLTGDTSGASAAHPLD